MANGFIPMELTPSTKLFEVERMEQVTLLRIAPHPFTQRYDDIHHQYNGVMKLMEDHAPPYLAIDFGQCKYIDSILVGTLVQLTHRARELDGNAVLLHLSDQIEEVLRSLMMLESKNALWLKYDNLEAAIKDLPW